MYPYAEFRGIEYMFSVTIVAMVNHKERMQYDKVGTEAGGSCVIGNSRNEHDSRFGFGG